MEGVPRKLVLGALLHDIGKVVLPAGGGQRGDSHSKAGADWLHSHLPDQLEGRDAVIGIAQWHHAVDFADVAKSPYSLLVYHADNVSAESDREVREGTYRRPRTPLRSIFSRAQLDGGAAVRKKPKPTFYKLETLSLDAPAGPAAAPEGRCSKEHYRRLLDSLETDFSAWGKAGGSVEGLLMLLEKHFSRVPSDTKRVEDDYETYPDISLFDHLKTTCAFVSALYRYYADDDIAPEKVEEQIIQDLSEGIDRDKNYFLFIGADVSGIQKFIYSISSRGALKGLRARSFYLEVLMEHVVRLLLERLGLTRANVIYLGGGRAYVLAQNTKRAARVLEEVEETVNKWLFEHFRHRLYLAFAAEPLSVPALGPSRTDSDPEEPLFRDAWRTLNEELGKKKQTRFSSRLHELFEPQEPVDETNRCEVCQRDDIQLHQRKAESEGWICDTCDQLQELGGELGRLWKERTFVIAGDSPPEGAACVELPALEGDGLYVWLSDRVPNDARWAAAVNSWNIEDYSTPSVRQILMGSYVRRIGELSLPSTKWDEQRSPHSVATFRELARAATGIERVGILRMDVDNLGRIFTEGLSSGRRTLSCMAALSRELTMFFKYYVNCICDARLGPDIESVHISVDGKADPPAGGRNVTVVYSGGDDLFIVGGWNDVVELAFDINRAWQAYTGSNPHLTISGGVAILPPDMPLYQMAEQAGRFESTAKRAGRNRLALFGPGYARSTTDKEVSEDWVFEWTAGEEALVEQVRMLVDFLNEHKAHGFVYKLFSAFEKYQRDGVLYLPHMAYLLGRLHAESKRAGEQAAHAAVVQQLEAALMNPEKFKNMRTVLTWVDMLTRSKGRTTNDS